MLLYKHFHSYPLPKPLTLVWSPLPSPPKTPPKLRKIYTLFPHGWSNVCDQCQQLVKILGLFLSLSWQTVKVILLVVSASLQSWSLFLLLTPQFFNKNSVLTLIASLEAPLPNKATWGFRSSTYALWRDTDTQSVIPTLSLHKVEKNSERKIETQD